MVNKKHIGSFLLKKCIIWIHAYMYLETTSQQDIAGRVFVGFTAYELLRMFWDI